VSRTIGISGGIASGKSTVARMLGDLGAYVIDADAIGHDVLRREDVKQRIVSELGGEILDNAGEIDRKKVGAMVFASAQRLKALEAIVHPVILEQIQEEIRSAAARGGETIVLDAALLYESGLDKVCDGVIFVDADEERRNARGSDRGWTAEERTRRERRQMDIKEKREGADWVVSNSGSLKELESRVKNVWQQIMDHEN